MSPEAGPGRWALPVFLLLLLPPSGAAAFPGEPTSTLDVASAVLGLADQEGALSALVWDGTPDSDHPGFGLQAARVQGTVQVSDRQVVVNGGGVTPATENEDEAVDVSDVRGADLATRQGGRFFLLPLESGVAPPTFQGADWAGPVGPHLGQNLSYEALADANQLPTVFPTEGTFVTAPGVGTITVQGSFRLVLWDADLVLDGNETRTVETGLRRDTTVPVPTMRGVEHTVAKEAYLDVHDATLTIQPGAGLRVFSPQPVLRPGAGTIALQDAEGLLAIPGPDRELDGNDVRLQGALSIGLERQEGRVTALVFGEPDGLAIDGRKVPLPEGGDGSRPWPWIFLLALVGVAGLAALAYAARQQSARHALKEVDDLLAKEAYEAAVPAARRLSRFRRYAEDAVVAEGVALLKLDRQPEAKALLQGKAKARHSPGRSFLLARIAVEEGRVREAEHWLSACLSADPSYVADAAADPVLAPIVNAVRAKHATPVGGYA